jgi:LemA protein
MSTTLALALAINTALAVWAVVIFNQLVRSRNQVRSGWSDIDVQLQRRHDLVPQLVEAVKGYASYERATLEAVTTLRQQSAAARGPAQKAQLESAMQNGLQKLLALAEDYPDLKANQNFLKLQHQLTEVEDHLQYARRFYNGAVRLLNTRIESFPDLLVARLFNFRAAEFFDADDNAAAAPTVELS